VIQTLPGTSGVFPQAIAAAPDGTVYEATSLGVNRIDLNGNVTTIPLGVPSEGPFPPCTPLAEIGSSGGEFGIDVTSIAVSPSGLLYVAGASGSVLSMVNIIDPLAGTVQTVAGQPLANGQSSCADNAIGTDGTFGFRISGMSTAPDGSIYLTDTDCNAVRRIGPDGSLSTVTAPYSVLTTEPIPSDCQGFTGAWTPGQLASTGCLVAPSGVALAPDGTIYVSDVGAEARISRIDARTGVISTFAGGNALGVLDTDPDGQLATLIPIANNLGLAAGGDGTIYALVTGYGFGDTIFAIGPAGRARVVGGSPASSVTVEAENGPAVGSLIIGPTGLAIHPTGSILVSEFGPGFESPRVRTIHSALPGYSPGGFSIPSEDGSEVYVFNSFGQHLSTVDPVTGATLRTFQYNANSQLTSITEVRGGTTTIAYNGTTVTVTPPFSKGAQQTTLTLDQLGGHPISLQTPAGETTHMTYSNGLMTSWTDPKSNLHTFIYDALGRLTQDTDPTSASILLQNTPQTASVPATGGIEPNVSWSTAVTSGAGHVTTHQDFTFSNGNRQRTVIAPSGATGTSVESSSGLWTSTAPDGTFTSQQLAPDPQFGMLDPYVGTMTRTTPSGISYGLTRTRTSTGSALAPSQIVDLTTMNGTSLWSSTFSAATGGQPAQWSYVSPVGRQRVQQLDNLGRVTSIAYPGSTTLPSTSFVYDADGRVQTVTVTANGGGSVRTTSMSYDTYLAGYLATVTDALGNVTSYDQRDNDGRVLDTQLPDFASVPQSHVAMSYDLNGNLATMTVPPATTLSSTHAFTDTPVDLLASYTPPQVSSTTTGTDPKLATLATSYSYNADRRITATSYPEGNGFSTVTQTYDTFGRLGSRFDPLSNITTTYQYATNAAGVSTDQIASLVTSDGVTVTNTFDGFLKTQVQWSSGAVSGAVHWTYDDFFRPATLQVGGAPGVTFAYDLDSLYVGTSSPVFNVTRDVAGSSLDGLAHAATLGTVSEAWTYDGFGAVC
jgi:YD repeat-containing protein